MRIALEAKRQLGLPIDESDYADLQTKETKLREVTNMEKYVNNLASSYGRDSGAMMEEMLKLNGCSSVAELQEKVANGEKIIEAVDTAWSKDIQKQHYAGYDAMIAARNQISGGTVGNEMNPFQISTEWSNAIQQIIPYSKDLPGQVTNGYGIRPYLNSANNLEVAIYGKNGIVGEVIGTNARHMLAGNYATNVLKGSGSAYGYGAAVAIGSDYYNFMNNSDVSQELFIANAVTHMATSAVSGTAAILTSMGVGALAGSKWPVVGNVIGAVAGGVVGWATGVTIDKWADKNVVPKINNGINYFKNYNEIYRSPVKSDNRFIQWNARPYSTGIRG